MVKDGEPEQGAGTPGRKGQDRKANWERQQRQLEIGELFKKALTHIPSLGQVEDNDSNSESGDSN